MNAEQYAALLERINGRQVVEFEGRTAQDKAGLDFIAEASGYDPTEDEVPELGEIDWSTIPDTGGLSHAELGRLCRVLGIYPIPHAKDKRAEVIEAKRAAA